MISCAAAGDEARFREMKTTLFIPTLNEIDGVKVIMLPIR
jgi:hypothetical protein